MVGRGKVKLRFCAVLVILATTTAVYVSARRGQNQSGSLGPTATESDMLVALSQEIKRSPHDDNYLIIKYDNQASYDAQKRPLYKFWSLLPNNLTGLEDCDVLSFDRSKRRLKFTGGALVRNAISYRDREFENVLPEAIHKVAGQQGSWCDILRFGAKDIHCCFCNG